MDQRSRILSRVNQNDWDIEAPELDEWRMRQLETNDPDLSSLDVTWSIGSINNRIDWSLEGSCFGTNTHLKNIKVTAQEFFTVLPNGEPAEGYNIQNIAAVRDNYEAFWNALALNTSIKRLHTERLDALEAVCGFVENNPSLQVLQIGNVRMSRESIQRLASALSKRCNENSLLKFKLMGRGMGDPSAGELFAALQRQSKRLEELCLVGSFAEDEEIYMERSGWVALGELLASPTSLLTVLTLEGTDMDDECATLLANALVKNRVLTKFALRSNYSLSRAGWKSVLSSLDSNTIMQELDFSKTLINDEGAETLATILVNLASLTVLRLYGCPDISRSGWRAVFSHLQNPNVVLETLMAGGNEAAPWGDVAAERSNIDDSGMLAMENSASNLMHLTTLKLTNNSAITSIGWKSFANLLQNLLALESLSLGYNNFGEEGAVAIGSALSNNAPFYELDLRFVTTGPLGWQDFFTFLGNDNCPLERLLLDNCHLGNEGLANLSQSLATNQSLTVLELPGINRGAVQITNEMWATFSSCLRSKEVRLKQLNLSSNHLDDAAAIAVASAVECTPSLKWLSLYDNRAISSVGWRAVAAVLRNPNSSLTILDVLGNTFGEGDACEFAQALTNNRTLKTLHFICSFLPTARGRACPVVWDAFSRLLCDTSSIAGVLASNHTLESIGRLNYPSAPTDISLAYLDMNQNQNKKDVAREKILQVYFENGNANMQEFAAMDPRVMPRVVRLIGNDLQLIFQLLKCMPTLIAPGTVKDVVSSKRKR